jgi:hypothetical protein
MSTALTKDQKGQVTEACIGAEIRGADRTTFESQVIEELDRNGFYTAENVRAAISTVLGRQAGRYRARSANFGSD